MTKFFKLGIFEKPSFQNQKFLTLVSVLLVYTPFNAGMMSWILTKTTYTLICQ